MDQILQWSLPYVSPREQLALGSFIHVILRDEDDFSIMIQQESLHTKTLLIDSKLSNELFVGDLIQLLTKMNELECLVLESCYIASNMLIRSISCMNLKYLSLRASPVSDAFMEDLFQTCQLLEAIDVSQTSVSPRTLYYALKHTSRLQFFNLSNTYTHDDSWPSLPIMSIAQTLILQNSTITDTHLTALSKMCPFLNTLDISHCKISDASMATVIHRCSQLKNLSLESCSQLTDVTLLNVMTEAPNRHYEYMNISFTDFQIPTILELMTHLNQLNIQGYPNLGQYVSLLPSLQYNESILKKRPIRVTTLPTPPKTPEPIMDIVTHKKSRPYKPEKKKIFHPPIEKIQEAPIECRVFKQVPSIQNGELRLVCEKGWGMH